VKLLQRLLKVQAVLWASTGALLLLAPGWTLETLLRQAPLGEVAWLRIAGVMSVVLALLMVLVQQKLEEVWWWSWAFAVLEAGTATICILHAMFGLPPGEPSGAWWLLGAVNGAFAAGLLMGIGYAGQERPFV
jgi:hypothetical protein